ncbi:hypothetical protein EX30DRAFT_298900, partial [Ascodesmis nigricans]
SPSLPSFPRPQSSSSRHLSSRSHSTPPPQRAIPRPGTATMPSASSTTTLPTQTMTPPSQTPPRRVMGGGISGIPSHAASAGRSVSMPVTVARPRAQTVGSGADAAANYRHSMYDLDRLQGVVANGVGVGTPLEKPQASTSGGAVTMTIQLAEPVLFLQGFDHSEYSNRAPAMLRGTLLVRVNKPTKIKSIALTFRGKARTDWPEGIPPKKSEYYEEKELMQHIWPFFDSRFPLAELGHCADTYIPRRTYSSQMNGGAKSLGSAIHHLRSSSASKSEHRLSIQLAQSRSFSKYDSPASTAVPVAQKGYRVFQPGDYAYNFELPLESCLPESLDVELGSVKYELEGTIERPGAFRSNLTGKKEVVLVRVPSESNLEASEPIAISRTWEDQLHYDIVISGKSFPLGATIPIAFKLTPLAKVRCHRIKIYITEIIEYSCKNKRVHRRDTAKKLLLFEKRAEMPATSTFPGSSLRVVSGGGFSDNDGVDGNRAVNGSDNLLGDLSAGSMGVGPTELEFNVQLPGCKVREKERIHFDTTYGDIQIHHWIKIVMRLSKQDPNDPSKRRHFEISIDSPFHILSCRANQTNTTLPEYHSTASLSSLSSPSPKSASTCSCPAPTSRTSRPTFNPRDPASNPSTRTNSSSTASTTSLTPPSSIFNNSPIPRPIHLIRQPSMNPPPFDADIPPPLVTPPPKYETVVNRAAGEGLADYFARLAEAEGSGESDGDENEDGEQRRELLPLTPGGRVARSMDERRTWEPI